MVTSPRRKTPEVSVKPSSQIPVWSSDKSRRSSNSPLRGTITPRLRLNCPSSRRCTRLSRCPSVATILTSPSPLSKKTPFRLCRVSSAEMANWVFSIISSSAVGSTGTKLTFSERGKGG